MRDDPIFVLSQPRAGSTLVQRLLNLDPGVLVMGENGGPLRSIASAYVKFEEMRKLPETGYSMDATEEVLMGKLKNPDYFCATAGGVRIEDVRQVTRKFVQIIGNPLRKDLRWGLKEVVTADIGTMVCELFPKAQIICVVRDPVDTVDSIVRTGWWGRDLEWICRDAWQAKFDEFRQLVVTYPGQVWLLRYERRSEALPEIWEWLGLDWTKAHQDALGGLHIGGSDTVGANMEPLSEIEKAYVRETCGHYAV